MRASVDGIIERFNTLETFKSKEDIPELPQLSSEIYKKVVIPNLIRCGAIPMKDLIVGKTYIGNCRNTYEATWNGKEFTYKRYKFGTTFNDNINHFEEDDGYDLFVPWKLKEEN